MKPLELGVTDNHGHAAWATYEQMVARFGSNRGSLIGASDRTPKATLWFDDLSKGPGHAMSVAGPGSDKTTTAIHRIWCWKGPRIVFDPSCEIGPIMTPALEEMGCNVTTIGLNSGGLNVLDWIDITHPEADAHIRSAVEWIYAEDAAASHSDGQQQSRDPFWGRWGRALVTCLMADMLYEPDPMLPKTLATLRNGIAVPEEQMQALLRGIHASSRSAMARDLAGGLMGMRAEETFSSIYSNSFAATEWLSVKAYADITSGNAIQTTDVLHSDTVVFVQVPLRTLMATPAVGRALLGALFNAIFHADGEGIEDTILIEIDEPRVVGPMKEIMLAYTTARKYRAAVHTIWQSEGQVDGVWGKDAAKELRDCCAWRSYNAVQDGDVAEKLARDLGERAVMAYSEGTNDGTQRQVTALWGSKSRGSTVSQHEIKRRLIKGDEILRAPAAQMFVLARDFPYPITCFTAPYYRFPAVNRLMAQNRFARVAAE